MNDYRQAFLFLALILLGCSNANEENTIEFDKTSVSEKIEGIDVLSFRLDKHEVEYIKIGSDTLNKKPVLLFLQGSLPIPLVIDFETFKHINLPFSYQKWIDKYHIIEIAMPHTPVVLHHSELDQQYCYAPNSEKPGYDTNYLKNNVLDNYTTRTHQVINDLMQKSWVDSTQIHVVGHSQGAKIATVLAAQNPNIASVSLLGFNAYGRFDESIRRVRTQFRKQEMSGEHYTQTINQFYGQWKHICDNPKEFKNGNNSAFSFSINYVPYLMQIDVPILIAYGTEDIGAENCDLLPLEFIRNNKFNFTMKPYLNLDHNFFELENDKPNYQKGHWNDVIEDIILWIEEEQSSN